MPRLLYTVLADNGPVQSHDIARLNNGDCQANCILIEVAIISSIAHSLIASLEHGMCSKAFLLNDIVVQSRRNLGCVPIAPYLYCDEVHHLEIPCKFRGRHQAACSGHPRLVGTRVGIWSDLRCRRHGT